LKKQIQDEFFSPAVLIGRKKLREYLDCPKMIENINNGLYNFENKKHIKMFDDYTALRW
jgi:hypothetical protein